MLAFRGDLFACEVGDSIDSGVRSYNHSMVQQTHGLSKINPAVAVGPANIRRKMIASDEFDTAVCDVFVGVFRSNIFIVFDVESVFLPAAGLADNVKKRQMAFRAIRELDFFHARLLNYVSFWLR